MMEVAALGNNLNSKTGKSLLPANRQFLHARCPSFHRTDSVEALKYLVQQLDDNPLSNCLITW